jgi:hypothetical protein
MPRLAAMPADFSQSAVSRLTGRNRKTVARYVAAGRFNPIGPGKRISREDVEHYLGRPLSPEVVCMALSNGRR